MARRGAELAQLEKAYKNTACIIISHGEQTEADLVKDSDVIWPEARMTLNQWRESGANVEWLLKCKNLVEDGYVEVTTIDSGNKSDD